MAITHLPKKTDGEPILPSCLDMPDDGNNADDGVDLVFVFKGDSLPCLNTKTQDGSPSCPQIIVL